jgi:hypothetical protein
MSQTPSRPLAINTAGRSAVSLEERSFFNRKFGDALIFSRGQRRQLSFPLVTTCYQPAECQAFFAIPFFLCLLCDISSVNNVERDSVGSCDNAAVRYQSLHVGNQIGRCVSPFVSGIEVSWHCVPTGMWHASFLAVVSLLYVFKSCLRGPASLERLLPLLTYSPLWCVC